MDLRLGWDVEREADQVKAQKPLSGGKPYLLILSPMCLAFSQLQALKTSLGVCMQSGRITDRARWTRSLRAVLEEVVGE